MNQSLIRIEPLLLTGGLARKTSVWKGKLVGMGCNTPIFVRWVFPFIFLSNCSNFYSGKTTKELISSCVFL